MSIDALAFASFDTPPDASVLAVDTGLDEYNQAAAPLSEVRRLATFANDAGGRIVGGAVGWTWGQCCELLQLWVEPAHRSSGVGSRLLQQFEEHAGRRGCNVFYLTTLSFQAPAFYRKHGYTSLAEISGYPAGIIKHLMHKTAPGPAE
jgi:ribosomal protein S18 acetylase RimI-like enzyme